MPRTACAALEAAARLSPPALAGKGNFDGWVTASPISRKLPTIPSVFIAAARLRSCDALYDARRHWAPGGRPLAARVPLGRQQRLVFKRHQSGSLHLHLGGSRPQTTRFRIENSAAPRLSPRESALRE
jgi:hypothetical protein